MHLGGAAEDRCAALNVARSLQSQLFFYEVEWNSRTLQDGVEDVYMFLDDQEGDDSPIERGELPTGIVTYLTRCYSPDCGGASCYSYSCPRKVIAPHNYVWNRSYNAVLECFTPSTVTRSIGRGIWPFSRRMGR